MRTATLEFDLREDREELLRSIHGPDAFRVLTVIQKELRGRLMKTSNQTAAFVYEEVLGIIRDYCHTYELPGVVHEE